MFNIFNLTVLTFKTLLKFLQRKWEREKSYRLKKYLWLCGGNRISVNFEYEYFDESLGQWYRAYGNENWEFDDKGLMRKRIAAINESPIEEADRRISLPDLQLSMDNEWLFAQGINFAEFPLRGGSSSTY